MKLDIPLYRLHNQHLLQDKFNQPAEVVRRLGAVQAQDFAGAKWAIGLRSNQLTDSDVERAFTDGSFLRTHLLRPTWHFVAPEDIRWMLTLTAPRVRAQLAYMDRQLELDQTFFRKSKALLVKTLQGGNQFTRAELERATGSHSCGRTAFGAPTDARRAGRVDLQRPAPGKTIYLYAAGGARPGGQN